MRSLAVLSLLHLLSSVSSQVFHVVPKNTVLSCSNFTECHTLGEYSEQVATYFTTGSTFVFSAGNHNLQETLNLTDVSNVTLRGEVGSYINIAGRMEAAILFNNSENVKVEGLTFVAAESDYRKTAIRFVNSIEVVILESRFEGNEETLRGLWISNSTITVRRCFFEHLYYPVYGGAIYISESSVTIIHSTFLRNTARGTGGAIYAFGRVVHLIGGNSFQLNSAESSGGAIECKHCMLVITGCNNFSNNSAKDQYSLGGAIRVINGALTITNTTCTVFSGNKALRGGAIFLYESGGSLTGAITFKENSAQIGGAIIAHRSSILIEGTISFIRNKAHQKGGAISISIQNNYHLASGNHSVLVSGLFLNNEAQYGGAIFSERKRENLTFHNVTAIGNTGSGLWITDCTITFSGYVYLVNNSGLSGGALFARNSQLSFTDVATFNNNKAVFGGAFYLLRGSLSYTGNTTFTHNTATKNGGAIYADGTRISLNNTINISFNSARNGGVMYFESGSFLTLKKGVRFTTVHNYAHEYGGVIYHQDTASPVQCKYTNSSQFQQLPYCFLQIIVSSKNSFTNSLTFIQKFIRVHSYDDSAGWDGSFLYGGLLDRCQLEYQRSDVKEFIAYNFVKSIGFKMTNKSDIAAMIASKPYTLCFCKDNESYVFNQRSCSFTSLTVYTGQKFSVSVIALAQGEIPMASTITANLKPTARMELNQSIQTVHKQCTKISYSVFSSQTFEEVTLYPEGPCHDNGLARAVVNLTIKPCPNALMLYGEECVCETRLQQYGAVCKLDESEHALIRTGGLRFWMSALFENKTYQGLILKHHCPVEYCTADSLTITINSPDIQCANHRSGMLCGACATNYSLVLGSSQCAECSNVYLALLLPFAAAGIALVVFLSVLRLTVATGLINGVIFYANIVQAHRNLFFPNNKVNVLTVFIAWLNLDLGFKTCFYRGLSSYAQTWLQFAFPLYVWMLITLIIFTSRYSITASKLIGHNPVAVLATLLLMSYTKTIKIIVDAYSYANLEYPNNEIRTMWLKDANFSYLRSWHLLLAVVTSLVFVLLFLPYTLLLLVGYKLLRFSDKKYFRWLNRIKPLLDSYYAPYKKHTRYWTGLLLLVRCILYIVFSLKASNIAVVLALAVIANKAWLSGRIYSNLHLDVIESSIHLNLMVLSTFVLAGSCPEALTYSLVSIVFTTMISIVGFQFLDLYATKTTKQLRITLDRALSRFKTMAPRDIPKTTANTASTSFTELRESLLDTY